MKSLKLAYDNVLRNKRRTFLTILITAVGVMSVLVGTGFANFTYTGLKEMAALDSGHLIMAHKNHFDKEEDMPMEFGLENYKQIAKEISLDREVRYALPRVEFSGLVSNGDKSTIFMGTGVDPAGEFKVKGPFLTMVTGTVLSRRETPDEPKVVIGKGMAKSMNVGVGDMLTLMGMTTEGGLNAIDVFVQGVMTTGVSELDKRSLFVNIQTAQEMLQTDKVSTLSVYLRETKKTDNYHAIFSDKYKSNAWQTWLDKAFYYLGVKGIYDRIFGLLGIVILILVFFSISNTVSMSVLERTREIGTLRAMGSYKWEVNRSFTLEGLVIGFIGSFVGMLMAIVISVSLLILELQMPPPPGRSTGYPLAIDIPVEFYGYTFIATIMVCMLAAWLSARKASKKPIVDALSHV